MSSQNSNNSFRRTWKTASISRTISKRNPSIQTSKDLVQARNERIDFSSRINKTQVVQSVREAGFACDVCDRTFKNSAAYFDHINSPIHLMRAGLSLRIERSTLEQVQQRIDYWKSRQEQGTLDGEDNYVLAERVKLAIQEEQDANLRRKNKEKEKRKQRQLEKEAQLAEFDDDEVASMMSFGGFRSTK